MIDMEHDIINPSKKTYFCDDIVTAILLKLPVKSLIRFTCVSKSWHSLIKNPNFIATHNKERRRSHYLLRVPDNGPRQTSPFFTFIRESSGREAAILKLSLDSDFCVVGSCEGLVCVVNSKSRVYLFNPLFQTLKILLPPSPCELETTDVCYRIQLGLGYSFRNNDYRIVKIIYNNLYNYSLNKVEIYSLKYNSWKSIDCTAPGIALQGSGVFINGCIKWVAIQFRPRQPFSTVMSFDIDKELFEELTKLQFSHTEECYFCNMKALACENSRVKVWVDWGRQSKAMNVATFDGIKLLETRCKNLLGFNVGMPLILEEKHRLDPRLSQNFQFFCVSESLMLFDHQDLMN